MTLRLDRTTLTRKSTIGDLSIDGAWFCHTLEPAGDTAIPEGVYPVIVSPSDRAKAGTLWTPSPDYLLPLLLNVPGREGIRLHSGNASADTSGCVLLGYTKDDAPDRIADSRPALSTLLAKLLMTPGAITLEVRRA